MEAATQLRQAHVSVQDGRVLLDHLLLRDEVVVRLVRDRLEAGDDPARAITDAIEIGARVLDREQTGANAEFVKTEFEKVSARVENEFGERARTVAELLGKKVDEVFDPDTGNLARSLDELFSDGSSNAVQHQVRQVVTEVMQRSREDLRKQFLSSDEGVNPLADFKQSTVEVLKRSAAEQHATNTRLLERMGELSQRIHSLSAEKEKLEELAFERERGTAKGRTYEEAVAEAIDAVAAVQGDLAEAVGDQGGAGGRKGDVLVSLDACSGPARGRIVFEAKDRKLSRPGFVEELDCAMAQRDADYAVMVVPGENEIPAKLHALREYYGDKLIVVYDPEEGSTLELQFAYRLARARVAIKRDGTDEVDAAALRVSVKRAVDAMDDVRKVKSQLTHAEGAIGTARELLEAMTGRVRGELGELDQLLATADPPGDY